MNYEEKYNEILEWARKNKARLNGVPIEEVLPELAESEDEKIRKELKEAFEAYDIESTWNGIPIRSIFAWLEKQKEQNLIMANSPQLKEQKQEKFPPYVTGFKGDPDPAGTSDLEEAAKEYASKTLCDPDDGPSTGLAKESFIAGAEWQKEQKPADEQFPPLGGLDAIKAKYYDDGFKNGFDEGVESVKPAEWSEEDEEILKLLILNIGRYMYFGGMSSERILSFLKSLRPQPKQEWSEEEKEILDSVLSHYVLIDKPIDANGIPKEKYISLIKSIRFDTYKNCNSHWKPSEEQMKALNEIVNILAASPLFHQNDYLFNILNGLREELKKLL